MKLPFSHTNEGYSGTIGTLLMTIWIIMYKHGKVGSRVHSVWGAMKQRCYNKNTKWYHNYGGRGIAVCDRWKDSFENFYADMGDPESGYTLDRIDNDGDYEPSNCKWSTRTEQANNTRSTVYLEMDGKRQSIHDWARESDIPYETLRGRYRMGWDDVRILTEKPMKMNTTMNYKGKQMRLSELAEIAGIKATTLHQRLFKYNWSLDRAMTTKVGA